MPRTQLASDHARSHPFLDVSFRVSRTRGSPLLHGCCRRSEDECTAFHWLWHTSQKAPCQWLANIMRAAQPATPTAAAAAH